MRRYLARHYAVCMELLFWVLVYGWLLFFKGDLLFRLQELSLFLWDGSFFAAQWESPAALLHYAALFLTQFCYLPWVGALLLTAGAWLLYRLVKKELALPLHLSPLALLPSLFVLLYVCRMGYDIYTLRAPAPLFTPILGLVAAWGLFMLYRHLRPALLRVLLLAVVGVAGYPLIGVYSLLALLLCLLHTLLSRPRLWGAASVTALIAIAAVPYLYFRYVYLSVSLPLAWMAGFPVLDFSGDASPLYMLVLAACCLTVAALPFKAVKATVPGWVMPLLMYGSLIALAWGSFNNENFNARLAMERAMNANRWDDALAVAAKAKNPTRVQVMYKNICLYKKGELLDRMFSFPDGSAVVDKAPRGNFFQMCAPAIFFHTGLLNFCNRWAMEQRVQYGVSIDNLRYMAKVAVYQGEKELARKYLDMLGKTLFYRYLAKWYGEYLVQPEVMQRDGEYTLVAPLMSYDEEGLEDADFVETTLLHHYCNLQIANPQQLQLSLAALLTAKQSDETFWRQFDRFTQTNRQLPVHLMEAALLFSYLSHDATFHLSMVHMAGGQTSAINKRFQAFMNLLQASPSRTPDATASFKRQYGTTYWFYYYFVAIGE